MGCSVLVASVVVNDKVFLPTRMVNFPLLFTIHFLLFSIHYSLIPDITLAMQTASSPAATKAKRMLITLSEICISVAKVQKKPQISQILSVFFYLCIRDD